ncbi:RNA polymerase sigma factor (sigma-70 family) [Silvibacterium bohemicum]|uniref:RNA polymerase sigma factor (Sigma-70 family) n=1 Tax=Silvibacterium bohemicum TaxID=1577686 RepID=A0A841JV31_9BACT|nr:sigma-70 family RNA polymerase sigma factor [Silvibacterium bohemicum]MBB6144385.1 RNA polymerase sigma factor (sigma-70 family) [Silvibacterium bohemicum]
MGLLKVTKIEKSHNHEEIFLDHYDWLLRSARDLCHGSREEAEDLVQDLYVGFVQSKSTVQVDDADRLRGYLYKALKNLFIRKNRRNRDTAAGLEISDFDSIQIALSSVDGNQLLLVRSRLAEICEYACTRRMTHKAASVLILRFFFGYYPSEIAKLLRTGRATVDKLTHTARLEAKAYLTQPHTLQFPHHQQHRGAAPIISILPQARAPIAIERYANLPDDPTELKAELRKRILSRALGDHLPREVIETRYSEESEQTLSTNELAHLVSCRLCLDTANDILGIPSLDMHFSSDDNEPDDQDPPSKGRRREKTLQRLRRKQREAFEHRPAQLQVAVNGQVLGTTAITGEFNEFHLNNLDMISRPEFVEVVSEQGITLASLDLLQVDRNGIPLQRTHVMLSDGRELTIDITWSGNGPGVNISYRDLPVEDSAPDSTVDGPTLSSLEIRALSEAPTNHPPASLWKKFTSLLTGHWMMPVPIAVGLGTLVLSAGMYFRFSQKTNLTAPITATALLSDSTKAEEAAIPEHGAMHRTFAFEVRSDQGKILESGTIDSLRGSSPRRRALRLLDRRGKVLAGHWVSETGKVTDRAFEHNRQSNIKDPGDQIPIPWIHLPEADDFATLSGGDKNLSAKMVGNVYEVNMSQVTQGDQPSVIAASLTLTKDTKRPVIEVLQILDHHSIRQYKFEELTYEYLPASPQLESDFAPPSGDTSGEKAEGGDATENSDSHATLEALTLLSNLGPDVERIVNVERTLNGRTSIDGVFQTTAQKAEVARVLAPLRRNHNIVLDLHASDEPISKPDSHPNLQLQSLDEISVESQRVPLDAQLRSSLSTAGAADSDVDARVHAIASSALEHCSLLSREAWSIRQIATDDFTPSELQQMTPEDQMLWLTLLDKHVRAFDGERTELERTLHALLEQERTYVSATPVKPPNTITSISELRDAAQTLNQDSERLQSLLTDGLTLSPTSLPTSTNPVVIAQLMSKLRVQESKLHEIVERLQSSGQR